MNGNARALTIACTVAVVSLGCGTPLMGPSPVPPGDYSNLDWPIVQTGPDGKAHARTYIVHVPQGASGSTPLPVVIDYHPLGANGFTQAQYSGMEHWADVLSFIAVHPDAAGFAWNATGLEPLTGLDVGLDDVDFTRQILATLDGHFAIDRNRIFVTGFSSGALMSGRVAMDSAAGKLAPYRIAAAATVSAFPATPLSAGNPTGPLVCPALAADPVPLFIIISDNDPVAASLIDPGVSGPSAVAAVVAKAHETAGEWASLCGNHGPPAITLTGLTGWGVVTETDVFAARVQPGPGDVRLDIFDAPANLATSGYLGHIWPGPPQGTRLDASAEILAFFAAHPRSSSP